MLQDQKLAQAVARIIQRSERQEDVRRLLGTYVDVGLLPQLDNRNHQVFYGRRGTGKTHVMKVLESRLAQDPGNTVVYIDCRVLGSTSQFADTSLPLGRRCLSLFRDILLAIYHALLEDIVERGPSRAEEALAEADFLAALISEPIKTLKPESVVAEGSASQTDSSGFETSAGFEKGAPKFSAKASGSTSLSSARKVETRYAVDNQDNVIFPELQRTLKKTLELAETRLVVLIDEWSSLPLDVQPYLAEFIKRGVLPLTTATIKISALEYRCRFMDHVGGRQVGFELGADIATAPDLDDYFVFDRNPEAITDIYADVLRRHLSTELPENYLKEKYAIENARQISSKLFSERATCAELSRAAEGVIRDLINIFTQSFFNAQRRGRENIDKKAVVESARQWFEQDKAQYLNDRLQHVMRKIVDDIIGTKKARSFLLPRELERHPTIQALFDARVLHHMQRGYADKDRPGVRYNIYAIDYGAYVDLIGTSKAPQLELEYVAESTPADVVVPFDDKRSIRRIVLSEKILEWPDI